MLSSNYVATNTDSSKFTSKNPTLREARMLSSLVVQRTLFLIKSRTDIKTAYPNNIIFDRGNI